MSDALIFATLFAGLAALVVVFVLYDKNDDPVHESPAGEPFAVSGGPDNVRYAGRDWQTLGANGTPALTVRGTLEDGPTFRSRGWYLPGNVGSANGRREWVLTSDMWSRTRVEDPTDLHWGSFLSFTCERKLTETVVFSLEWDQEPLVPQHTSRIAIGFKAVDAKLNVYYMEVNLDRTRGYDLYKGDDRIDRRQKDDILYWNGPEISKHGWISLNNKKVIVHVDSLFRKYTGWKTHPDNMLLEGVYFGTEVRGPGEASFRLVNYGLS